jgi:hypothetical protein
LILVHFGFKVRVKGPSGKRHKRQAAQAARVLVHPEAFGWRAGDKSG